MTQPTIDAGFARVNELVLAERLPEALDLLDALADRASVGGAAVDEARARRLGAAVARIMGDVPGAILRGQAVTDAEPDTWRSARIELGEAHALAGDRQAAAAAWREVLATPLEPRTRAAVLRKLAGVLGDTENALEALEEAQALARGAGNAVSAARLAVESAGLAGAADHPAAEAIARRARARAQEAGDAVALADLELLAAARALTDDDPQAALAACARARKLALQAVAPLQYIGASLAFARVADAAGERVQAYESLAVGWVTLADLLGADAARSVYQPELERMREQWGADEFGRARGAYEARRRAERS